MRIGGNAGRLARLWRWLFPIPAPIELCSRCHNPTKEGADRIGCCESIDVCHGPGFTPGSCLILGRQWS